MCVPRVPQCMSDTLRIGKCLRFVFVFFNDVTLLSASLRECFNFVVFICSYIFHAAVQSAPALGTDSVSIAGVLVECLNINVI